jgi:hypothetical protein
MFFPPDPDDHTEMRILIAFLGAVARGGAWGIAFGLLLLIAYAIARLVLSIVVYLFQLYRERLTTPSPYSRYFRILLYIAMFVLIASYVVYDMYSQDDLHKLSIALMWWDFGIFCVGSFVLDWRVGRLEQDEAPSLEGVTIDDVVAWQNQINEAYEAGLMARE